jgi:predicted dehydrogenase
MKQLQFALLGTGFWAGYQMAAWNELPGARCVALYNRTRQKAAALAEKFAVPAVYDDLEELFEREQLDFVDIVTAVEMHAPFTRMAAERGIPVICQKPLAASLAEAEEMHAVCKAAGVPLLVNENWRWQTPLRELKRLLDEDRIGMPHRARIDMISGFPVFRNQPFLAELEQFILTDLGTHLLDTARFLFGEAEELYCHTQRVHPQIRGEDVATVMLKMNGGRTTVLCELAYAENPLERECFPQTLAFIEGARGSLELCPDYVLRLTDARGTQAWRVSPPEYAWCDPAYAVVQASGVACQGNLLAALLGQAAAETTGEDNLRTLRLVFAAYDSARTGQAIRFVPAMNPLN